MKNTIKFVVTILTIVVALNISVVHTNSGQPISGVTGAPGETTCNTSGCHTGSSVVTNSSQVFFDDIRGSIFVDGYIPDQTYNMDLFLSMPAARFGFQTTALDSNNDLAGRFSLIDTSSTAIQTSVGTGRSYVNHLNASSLDGWAFRWTAPAAGTDTVSFYIAANAANGSGSGGDVIHTGTFTAAERPSGCDRLFISEYVEGSDYNIAIEIYNPTAYTKSLYSHHLLWYYNGDTAPAYGITFVSGSVPPYGTIVITGNHPNMDTTLNSIADNTSIYGSFDGSEACILFNSFYDTLDVFGVMGQSPSSGWTGGGLSTQNRTLVRKPTVRRGLSGNPTNFDPSEDWDGYPQDFFDSLGTHLCICDTYFCSSFSVSLTGQDVSCFGGNDGRVDILITGGSGGGIVIVGDTSGLNAGNYSLTITDTTGGCTVTESFTVGEPTLLTLTADADSIECGTTNTGKAWATASGGTTPYSYGWNIVIPSNDTISGLVAGTYHVTVTDANGCFAVDSVEVFQKVFSDAPSAIVGVDTACLFTNSEYIVTPEAGIGYTWALSGGGTLVQSNDTAAINWNIVAGTYTLSVTGNNYCGAGPTTTKTIEVLGAPFGQDIAGVDTVCLNDTEVYMVPGGVLSTSSWNLPTGGNVTAQGDTATVEWNSAGDQQLISTNTNQCGSYIDTLVVTVVEAIISLGNDTTVCDDVTLSPIGTMGDYLWSDASTGATLNVLDDGSVGVTVTDAYGCTATDEVDITVEESPNASFTYLEISEGEFSFTDGSTSTLLTYVWEFGNGVSSTLSSPSISYSETGSYIVSLTISNNCGISIATDTIDVVITNIIDRIEYISIEVYPNPATEKVHLIWPPTNKPVQVDVFNSFGAIVMSNTIIEERSILDIAELPAGLYLLRVQHSEGVAVKKMIVE